MNLEIINVPDAIKPQNEYELEVKLEDAPKDEKYYLAVALTSENKHSYFGYTYGSDEAFHHYSEEYSDFYSILTDQEGSWSGKLKFKFLLSEKNYLGPGLYLIKLARYTESGKSKYWSNNEKLVKIDAVLSPTEVKLSPTQTSNKTQATKNIQAVSTITSKPTSIKMIEKEITISKPQNDSLVTGGVLGASFSGNLLFNEHKTEVSSISDVLKKDNKSKGIFIFMLIGGALTLVSIIESIKIAKKAKNLIQ